MSIMIFSCRRVWVVGCLMLYVVGRGSIESIVVNRKLLNMFCHFERDIWVSKIYLFIIIICFVEKKHVNIGDFA